MSEYNFNSFNEDDEPLSESFIEWDTARRQSLSPGYFDADEMCEIVDTYLSQDQIKESKEAISYALRVHPDNEDMVYDLMQILNDYELWNDLLTLTQTYKYLSEVWLPMHQLTALLHLGMEEDAFLYFKNNKQSYLQNLKDLAILYTAMSEALYNVDLHDAAIEVAEEYFIKTKQTDNADLLWIQLRAYQAAGDNKNVEYLAEKLAKLSPLDADSWSRIGLIYKEIGEKEKSIEAFEFASSLGKSEPIDILNLIYSYKENGNLLKALEKADEFLQQRPNDYIINLLAATLAYDLEDWVKALIYIDKALELDKKVEFLYLHRCKCFLALGEIKKAIQSLELGLQQTKDSQGEIQKELDKLRTDYPTYK